MMFRSRGPEKVHRAVIVFFSASTSSPEDADLALLVLVERYNVEETIKPETYAKHTLCYAATSSA